MSFFKTGTFVHGFVIHKSGHLIKLKYDMYVLNTRVQIIYRQNKIISLTNTKSNNMIFITYFYTPQYSNLIQNQTSV